MNADKRRIQFSLDPEILRYYDRGQEAERLNTPLFRWEKIRTFDILERFLPPAPAVVVDVGGGVGAYAFPLAEQGYIVDLIDLVPLHIEQARERAASHPNPPRSLQVGDARAIPCSDGAADAVLLLGPLYHLTEAADRLRAIREARRVLRVGGVLMAVAISRFASLIDGLMRGLIRDPALLRLVEDDLKTGQHRNDSGNPEYFTTAFFHHPDELKAEMIEGGFPSPALCAIEGPVWRMPEEGALTIMRSIESEPALMGASAHFMAIAKKPA